MELTKKQEEGLKVALERYKNNEKYTVISGYAGTGKSTLVKFIIEALDVEKDKVAYATFTGKAAEVLRKKGNPNAITLHKLLYDSFPKPGGGFVRKPKLSLGYDIVVVDEVSMVPKDMIVMLLKHKTYILFLGDPFQLPQIDKNQAHDLLETPHVFLDQIMRQAAESEIIQLTMKIRNGEKIPYMKGKEVQVIPRNELVTGCLTWADSVICATNATRHNLNNQMRTALGHEGLLCEGDKILIKRNYWDDCNEEGDALVNGTIGTVHNIFNNFVMIPRFIKCDTPRIDTLTCDFAPDGTSNFNGISLDKNYLETEEPCVDWRISFQLGKMKMRIGDILPKQATYGYALTCHSAQGSSWPKVLVIEENFPFDKKEHARWLYTACTRPEQKLVLVRE